MEEAFKGMANPNRNRFSVSCDATPDTMIIDYQILRKIVLNLLKNATKFTHDGMITLKVYSCTRDNHNMINFEVSDSGDGISPDKLDSIFEPFEQVDNTATRRYGGVGMGLTIARQLARLLGGDISVSSELGKGSVFTLSFPQHKGF
jgi:signal transduction histidine kinase